MSLAEIKECLKSMGLVQSRCPTIKELKSKLRKLQKQFHPDKNDDKDDSKFKKVMEDAEKVLLFIRDHPELQDKDEDVQDIHLLQFLRVGEELQVNKESYTIFLGTSWGNLEELVESTENALKSKRVGEGTGTCRVATTALQGEIDNQGVTVTFWFEPKGDKKSKMLIQGKAHEAFLLFVLPEILKEASDKMGSNPLALQMEDLTKNNSGGQAGKTLGNGSKVAGTGELEVAAALTNLQKGFHQLELTVRDFDTRMVKVEEKMAKVEEKMVKVEEKLENVLSSLPKGISTEMKEMAGNLKEVEKLLEKARQAHPEPARPGNDSEVLLEINSGIKELVKAVGGQSPHDKATYASLAVGANKGRIVEAEEVPRKKAVVIASSVGRGLELKKIAEKLLVKVELLEATGIEAGEGGTGLEEVIKNVEKPEIVIIQCGSSDVTRAETGENANLVRSAGEKLVSLAAELAEKKNCEVFISQLPPRYDDAESGKGNLAKLTEVFNNQVKASAMFLAQVHIVSQGRLASSGKNLEVRYESDGLHLTEVGAGLLTKSVIEAIGKVRNELVVEEVKMPNHQVQPQAAQSGKQENSAAVSRGRGGRGRGFEERGGRGRGAEEAWRQAPPSNASRWRGGHGGDYERPWDQRVQGNWGYRDRGPYYGQN